MAYIEMKNSYKRYKSGQSEIIANNDISFEIEKGELAIILGSSGAGKSTVLNIRRNGYKRRRKCTNRWQGY